MVVHRRFSAFVSAAVVVAALVASLLAVAASPVSAATDTTPPTLADFSFAPTTIDTTDYAQAIAFTAHITDDLSGVATKGSQVEFDSADGHHVVALFDKTHQASGTPLDGIYRHMLDVPKGAQAGTWVVKEFVLVDVAGNTRTLTAADLSAAGFPSSFTNTPGSGQPLRVTKGGSGTGTVTSAPVGINCGSRCATAFFASTDVALTAAPDASSWFVGWAGACTGTSSTCHVTMDTAKSVKANFKLRLRRLTVVELGRGAVQSTPKGLHCPGFCSHRFTAGSTVHLAEHPAPGWHFLRWERACSGTTACAVPMSADRFVDAVFAPDVAPLGSQFSDFVSSRSDRVGVAVYDANTGTTYVLNEHGQFQTGSIVKVQIMGTVLRRAQDEHRGLTSYESSNMTPMIEVSDNDAATNLWNSVGQASGVEWFDRSAGLTETTPSSAWGLTSTTAWDNVRLVRDYAYPSDVLDARWRAYGLYLMEHVTSWQRWGISAGPTEGTTVAIKNGWLPLSDSAVWRVNSIGWVKGHGRNYVIAVLTDHNPSMSYGIDTIQGVSEMVWQKLG